MKIQKKKKIIILLFLGIVAACLIIFGLFNNYILNKTEYELEKNIADGVSYKTYEMQDDADNGTVLVTLKYDVGIDKILYTSESVQDGIELYTNGKNVVAYDTKMKDRQTYNLKITLTTGQVIDYPLYYEIPRINGEYELNNGIYVNKPDLTGFEQDKTRYLYMKDVVKQVTSDDGTVSNVPSTVLTPGNWIKGDEPDNWYNYKESSWANIYVENNGVSSFWVWIPRYCYKVDNVASIASNERMDVKFINTYNEYKDPLGNVTTWHELELQRI